MFTSETFAVYPRVRVRDAEEMKIMVKVEMSCAVRSISSLSLEKDVHDSGRSNAKISGSQLASSNGRKKNKYLEENRAKIKEYVKDQKQLGNPILPLTRTAYSDAKISSKPVTVVPELKKGDSALHEDTKTNIKSSFVPMPRAVLSSPENDELIGSQNQVLREKQVARSKQTPVSETDHVLMEKKLGSAPIVKEGDSNKVMRRKHPSVPRQRPPFKF